MVMPLLPHMSMDDSSWWLLDSGASATVLAEVSRMGSLKWMNHMRGKSIIQFFGVTTFWTSVAHLVRYSLFHSCQYGSARQKKTVIAFSHRV